MRFGAVLLGGEDVDVTKQAAARPLLLDRRIVGAGDDGDIEGLVRLFEDFPDAAKGGFFLVGESADRLVDGARPGERFLKNGVFGGVGFDGALGKFFAVVCPSGECRDVLIVGEELR